MATDTRVCVACETPFAVTHGNQKKCPECRVPYRTPIPCLGCGTRVQPFGNRKYCLACQVRLDIRPRRVCEECGTSFAPLNGLQRFCKPICADRHRRVKLRTCLKCGEEFHPTTNQLRCAKCRTKTTRRNPAFYRAFKKDHCEKCGFVAESPAQLDVHHIDGDCLNDVADNLETVCANCHRLMTQREREARRALAA